MNLQAFTEIIVIKMKTAKRKWIMCAILENAIATLTLFTNPLQKDAVNKVQMKCNWLNKNNKNDLKVSKYQNTISCDSNSECCCGLTCQSSKCECTNDRWWNSTLFSCRNHLSSLFGSISILFILISLNKREKELVRRVLHTSGSMCIQLEHGVPIQPMHMF